ncbi:MAG TPA: UDP-3-O-acyl-N-acetylglucosamine deacetylase [Thermodesulfobacteriota bacterium]|nr:UDP-3-O-acyl-N-acetylglucosamine deacetylase [Thermodesulfobacteriota bacterium]
MRYQKTIKKSISGRGVGLHSGKDVNITLRPAVTDTGIVFKRVDLPGSPSVKAVCDYVSDTRLATTIKKGDATVATVEHLMAAFSLMRIDNAIVEIDGPEVPIMDGSASFFVKMIKEAGIIDQEGFRRYIVVKRPVMVESSGSEAAIYPAAESRITCSVDFNHQALEPQSLTVSTLSVVFEEDISDARTFGFLKDIDILKANGLALGGSLENAVVIDESGIINEEGLRFPDELVRHKVLDSIGDLYLMGSPVIGHFMSYKGGHTLTHKLVSKLLSDTESWEYLEFKEETRSQREKTRTG